MRLGSLAALRLAVVATGLVAGALLVRALDEGFAREPRPLTLFHGLFGVLTAAVALPGPLLGFFVRPSSSERARGLAVGGSAVTALAALLGGALAWRRVAAPSGDGLDALVLLWALLALPLAFVDFLRLRRSGAPEAEGTRAGSDNRR